MFQRLQELPLFQGLNLDDVSEIVAKVRFDFQQLSDNEEIVGQDSSCKQLIFVLKGDVNVEYIDPDRRYRFTEKVSAPIAIEPQNMFGMTQKYQRTYTCISSCQTLTIERAQFLSVMMNYPIVKINALNMVCNLLQRANKRLDTISHESADVKLVQFLRNNSLYPKGEKQLYTTMESLAEIFSETRLNVSRALKRLNQKGLMKQERKAFTILAIENL